ncbi:hypothetical protein F511_12941 [Dorcoceras hygrometricum]|uniref:Uncharacterized protein n=1 Tax=Dorcoceras hygrometricum TaxID=472368 RepID=A0A2Z7CB30_9LAMI|nr:hypothetical protein F511_12941 [Dorcoceras hygrometricum]
MIGGRSNPVVDLIRRNLPPPTVKSQSPCDSGWSQAPVASKLQLKETTSLVHQPVARKALTYVKPDVRFSLNNQTQGIVPVAMNSTLEVNNATAGINSATTDFTKTTQLLKFDLIFVTSEQQLRYQSLPIKPDFILIQLATTDYIVIKF